MLTGDFTRCKTATVLGTEFEVETSVEETHRKTGEMPEHLVTMSKAMLSACEGCRSIATRAPSARRTGGAPDAYHSD
jgi:hypothetical protein